MDVAHAEQTQVDNAGQMGDGAAPAVMDIVEEPVTNLEEAIEKSLKLASIDNGVKVGCNQVMRAIEAERAHCVFLATNVEEKSIAKAVTLLAESKKVPVIEVPDCKELGRWAGLCKIDREGQARKIVGASCVAITDYATVSPAFEFLHKHIQSLKK
eukprot:Gregarina_sp_Pseudo_9__1341@NODE_189_length_3701_cov_142_372747_g174_i0_p2_GENE_NODE_189_length_3701_cov_142_372747_g174_i0NODE_189_length_3701_cov_142_372747_g174_i0_p2_ORF_typecomplete_len156_score49_32Ribosomal_L7Ae/PF01248_26/1_4e14Methyltransf_18/PF12847_7/0_07PELOTA_1/PF15608_6/0_16SpoU_sub_bind/PF08032_12/0_21RNase_P_pop3/PF08228_11/0_25PHP/PF02811_19/1_1e02PHP/PF02811_19/3_3_NODE_189_length_3701_cov_142_372747_g174_i030873554